MIKRKVFYSFHYDLDNWRCSQVRNIGAIEGSRPATDNDWETVKRGGDPAIKRWIDNQLIGCSCTVVLIGSETSERHWVKYEIEKSWTDGKGILGIFIHGLQDRYSQTTIKGNNPFDYFTLNGGQVRLSSIVKTYDPVGWSSQQIYNSIASNLSAWVEEAVRIRKR
jgi:hypothetical protein